MSQFTMITLLVIGFFIASNLQQSEADVGICYRNLGDNLPSTQEVVALLAQKDIQRIRLYDQDETMLSALRGKNIEVVLGISNLNIQSVVATQETADSWVQKYVKSYSPDVKFRYIVVGDEISVVNANSRYSFTLLDAMDKIQKAISKAGLQGQVKVSTSFDLSILGDSFPPSNGSFNTDVRFRQIFDPMLKFLSSNGAPFLVNLYPYFSYIKNPNKVMLQYAMFKSSTNVVTDGKYGYKNLFDVLLDSLYSALEKAGYGSMEIVVLETGWPSAGGISASVKNQKIYHRNLVKHVKKGTPKRPGKPIETYVFSMFDENKNNGPEIERHWGLFFPNKEMKFHLKFHDKTAARQTHGIKRHAL